MEVASVEHVEHVEPTEQVMTCEICVETFNKTIRKKTTCSNCDINICAKCVKRYLTQSIQQPNCMQCKTIYTEHFMDTQFSVNFRKTTLQKLREDIMIEKEKQHLPGLMHRAAAFKEEQQYVKRINEVSKKYNEVHAASNKLINILRAYDTIGKNNDDSEYLNVQNAYDRLRTEAQVHVELNKIYRAEKSKLNRIYMYGGTVRVSAIINCITNGCKGFLDNDFKCGLCSITVCKDCHEEIIGGDNSKHSCNAASVETIKMIQSETKPCSKCSTPIYKIEGCDQMFCTQCHTAFSWTTGLIETGRIHNPHYFQWLRTRHVHVPREIGDVPCGGLPHYPYIENILLNLLVPTANILYCRAILSLAHFIQDKELPKYPVTQGRSNDMDISSIHYLAGIITEKQWGNQLFKHEKLREINTEKRLILDMLLAVLVDYFNKINLMTSAMQVDQMLTEIEQLRCYYNSCIENLCKGFEISSFKKIRYDWSKLY